MNVCDIGSGAVNVRCAVGRYVKKKVEEYQVQAAELLRELLFICDDHLVLSNNVSFTCEELKSLINYKFELIRLFQ